MSAPNGQAQLTKGPAKRAYHTKSKNGCKTCKIRRLRCDEGKPSCLRCVSTGRKCDGYSPAEPNGLALRASASTSAPGTASAASEPPFDPMSGAGRAGLVPSLQRQLRVPMPRSNQDELRSFRYFLEVASPQIAGVFDWEFWLGEIPRACHVDAAVWHATVSLGALHERYAVAVPEAPPSTVLPGSAILVGTVPSEDKRVLFAVQQFNAAIGHLIRNSQSAARPGSGDNEKWRALTASVLFTYICSIQGLQKEALVHLEAGAKLLRELERTKTPPHAIKNQRQKHTPQRAPGDASLDDAEPVYLFTAKIFKSSPVSLAPLHTIITAMEISSHAIRHGGLTGEPALVAQSDNFSAWRFYTSPCSSLRPTNGDGDAATRYATPQNIANAGRAMESLLNGMTVNSQHAAAEIATVVTGQPGAAETWARLVAQQESLYRRAFTELTTSLDAFESEVPGPPATKASQEQRQKRKAVASLRLYHTCCRLCFLRDHEFPDPLERVRILPALYERMVDTAEEILKADLAASYAVAPTSTAPLSSSFSSSSSTKTTSSSSFMPTSSTTNPLLLVAHSGQGDATRRRAIDLMRRYPRREGLWHSIFLARIAEVIMAREEEVRRVCEKEGMPPAVAATMAKVHNIKAVSIGHRDVRMVFTTWREWMRGEKGVEEAFAW